MEYLVDLKAERAAKVAGFGVAVARSHAYQWVSDRKHKPHVYDAIHAELQRQTDARILDADELSQVWSDIACADRNEIAELWRVPCRHCHGKDHEYQERAPERAARKKAHDALLRRTPASQWALIPPFDELGGTGYTRRKEPHPACPMCDGDGEEYVRVQDTRKLSRAARAVYEGIDIKNGHVVVKMFGRKEATEMLARRYEILRGVGASAGPHGDTQDAALMIEATYPDDIIDG